MVFTVLSRYGDIHPTQNSEQIMNNLKKSKGDSVKRSYHTHYALCVKIHGRGKTEGAEKILSTYKSLEDAEFIMNFLNSNGKSNYEFFSLSENDELFVKSIPAFVSFGEELPSTKKEFSELSAELDKLLESLEPTEEE